mgnify:CR=1 FL=1
MKSITWLIRALVHCGDIGFCQGSCGNPLMSRGPGFPEVIAGARPMEHTVLTGPARARTKYKRAHGHTTALGHSRAVVLSLPIQGEWIPANTDLERGRPTALEAWRALEWFWAGRTVLPGFWVFSLKHTKGQSQF